MMQLMAHIGIASVITIILLVFLITNLTAITSFLYQTGNDSQALQRFALGSTISVLLFVLLGILLFSLIFLLLQRKMARDIETIARAVKQISEGDLSTRLELEGEGELTDIAENLNRMEEDIQELIDKERTSEQSKTDLITNVAHDLRTPLTSILGYLELLRKNQKLSQEMQQKYLDIAYNKSVRLQKLIEELFGFTKLSYGKINMNVAKVDIVELLAQLLEESYPNFQKNGLSYDFVSNRKSQIIEADGDLLARLFDNLIGNAIKYMDKKRGIIQIRVKDVGDFIQVEIEDNGKGIAAKDIPSIFDRFYRTDVSRNSSKGGSGIGLSIVKKILEDHGGKVWATSREGIGTIMYFVLRKYQEVPMK